MLINYVFVRHDEQMFPCVKPKGLLPGLDSWFQGSAPTVYSILLTFCQIVLNKQVNKKGEKIEDYDGKKKRKQGNTCYSPPQCKVNSKQTQPQTR